MLIGIDTIRCISLINRNMSNVKMRKWNQNSSHFKFSYINLFFVFHFFCSFNSNRVLWKSVPAFFRHNFGLEGIDGHNFGLEGIELCSLFTRTMMSSLKFSICLISFFCFIQDLRDCVELVVLPARWVRRTYIISTTKVPLIG